MNEKEAIFRGRLRWFRYIANRVGLLYQDEQIMFSRWPETQALAIVEGHSYHLAAYLVIQEVLASGQLNLDVFKYPPFTGFPPTNEEILEVLLQQEEKRLKQLFGPLEVWPQVIMPVIKSELEKIERIMVEQGYRLPRWERPKWLRETEKYSQ